MKFPSLSCGALCGFLTFSFVLFLSISPITGQVDDGTLTMNKSVKAWGYNPDGSITIKYLIVVRNNGAVPICNLVVTDLIDDPAFLMGNTFCSSTQGATTGGGFRMAGLSPTYTGSNTGMGATPNFRILGPTGANGEINCLAPNPGGQLRNDLSICFTVKIGDDGLNDFTSGDMSTVTTTLVNVANVSGTAVDGINYVDTSNDEESNDDLGTDADEPTTQIVKKTCVYPGLAKDITQAPAQDSGCGYSSTITYQICNFMNLTTDHCVDAGGGGEPSCDGTNVMVMDDNVLGIPNGPSATNITATVTYNVEPGGGMLEVNLADPQSGNIVTGGIMPPNICETVVIDFAYNYCPPGPAAGVCGLPIRRSTNTQAMLFMTDSDNMEIKDASTSGLMSDTDPSTMGCVGAANDCAPTRVTHESTPNIDLVKSVSNVRPVNTGVPTDEHVFVDFSLIVSNNGTVDLNTLSVIDEVVMQLDVPGGCFVDVIGIPSVNNVSATNPPVPNPGYTGAGGTAVGGTTDLLLGAPTDLLGPGQSFEIVFTVELDSENCPEFPTNGAATTARDCCDRLVKDPDVPDAQFSLAVTVSSIEMEKEASDPVELPNGNYSVTYTFSVVNSGSQELDRLSLVDNLGSQLGCTYLGVLTQPVVSAPVGSGATSVTPVGNAAYDGISITDLLTGVGVIVPGESFDVEVTVELDADCSGMPLQPMTNEATITAQDEDDNGVIDFDEALTNLPCTIVADINDISLLCQTNPNGSLSLSSMLVIDDTDIPIENTEQGGTFSLVSGPAGGVVQGGSTLNYTEAGCYEIMYTVESFNNANCAEPIEAIAFVLITEQPQPDFEMQNEVCLSAGGAAYSILPTVSSPAYDAESIVSSEWTITDAVTNAIATIDAATGEVSLTPVAGDISGTATVCLTEEIDNPACGFFPATVVGVDGDGCSEQSCITITVMDGTALDACFTAAPNPVCVGEEVTLTPNTDGGVFTGTGVTDNAAGTGGTFTATVPGTYQVDYTISTANGCTNVCSQNIVVLPAVDATLVGISTCDIGQVNLESLFAATTTPGGTFTATVGTVVGSILTYPAGTASIDVTYAVGDMAPVDACYQEGTATITVSPQMTVTFVVTPEECPNDGDAMIVATVAGDSPVITFDWSNDGSESPDDDAATVTGLTAGVYTLTVTDGEGCMIEESVLVPAPEDNDAPVVDCATLVPNMTDLECRAAFPDKLALADFAVTDNCTEEGDIIFIVADAEMSTAVCPSGVSAIMRTYTFIDESGNATQCTQMISYAGDTEAPVPVCVAGPVVVTLDADGNGSLTQADLLTSVADNCTDAADVDVDISQLIFGKTDIGMNTVTITVTDECGNVAMCTVPVTVVGAPELGVAKREVSAVLLDNGCFQVTYEFNIENLGNTDLNSLQLVDDLAGAGFGMCGSFSIASLTSDDFTINPGFTGMGAAGVNLLTGANTLACGDKGAILLTVETCACPADQVIVNSATGSAEDPLGNTISDDSTSGSDPESGDMPSDTETTLSANPDFGVAKREVQVVLQDDGCSLITYEINVENLGNTNITALQVTDDLVTAPAGLGAPCVLDITSITSDDFVVNAGYNGAADIDLLTGTDVLQVGDKGAILFTVEACGCANPTTVMNSATGTGNGPDGLPIVDESTSGSDPEAGDVPGPTMTSLTAQPDLGIAKREVSLEILSSGCVEIVYEFNIENLGNVTLNNLQAVDDLAGPMGAGFGLCGAITTTLTSDEFIVNDAFDGLADINMLDGSDNITPGDVGAILLTVEACNCPNPTPIMNSATASGDTPDGGMISDASDSGSDPDSGDDGEGDPTTQEDDATETAISFDPSLGVAKRGVGVWLQDDGCFLVEYEINVENFGNTPILDLQVTDDLAGVGTPPGAGYDACASYSIKSLTSDDFIVNDDFNGLADIGLLNASDILEIGDKGAINFVVEACGCPVGTMIANSATGSGTDPSGDDVSDVSASGSDPDGTTDDDDPSDSGTTNTELIEDADLGLAKRVVTTELKVDGCTEIVYEFNLENLGNVTISDIQVTDDLNLAGFGNCEFVQTSLTSDEFIVNPAYNGGTDLTIPADLNLLSGNDNIVPGDVGSILLTVEACSCPNPTSIANAAEATGTSPGGATIDDDSSSGADPDPNGMGEGDNDPGGDQSSTTDFSIEEMPDLAVAKREVGIWLQDDGCSLVEYEINVENLGNVALIDLQVIDDLVGVDASGMNTGAGFNACDSYTIKSLTSDDFIVNDQYDGDPASAAPAGINLLSGIDVLEVGDKGAINFVIEACGCPNGTTIANSTTGMATSPAGDDIEDNSSSGSNPDPTGDGEDGMDEMSTTNSTLSEDADAGLAKRVVSTRVTPDGCTELVYEFNIENLGNVTISDIQVTDDLMLAGFGVCTDGAGMNTVTTSLTSDEFIVNPNYDGFAVTEMLLGDDNINPGDVGSILLTVEACGCPAASPISNRATLTGESPGGAPIEDMSDSGSDPDSDGMGEDGTDEDVPTGSTIGEMPDFGVAKREVGVWLQDDGCFLVTYELNVENLGTAPISNLQVVDNLDAAPAGAGYDACASYIIKELTSDDFIVNDAYDGNADTDLLVGTDLLEVGDKGAILFTVEACGCPVGTEIANIATGSGMTPGGATIEDMSSSGSDPDPDGTGETTDQSGTTNTTLSEDADAGLAKRVVSTRVTPDGCTELVYEFNIENLGNVTISDIQVEDDLAGAGFGACTDGTNTTVTTTLTSDEFIVNDAYNGLGNNDLLIGTDNINPGDVGSILLTVEACGCPAGSPIANTATLTGTSPGGAPVDDVSDSGSDPDSDGKGENGLDEDGNPVDDEMAPTVSTIGEMPDFGVAKREVGVWLQDDGCFLVTYELNVENLGTAPISNLQVVDNLDAAPAGAGYDACASYIIKELTSDDFIVNDAYDGNADTDLLVGTDLLEVGDKGAIEFTVEACGCPDGTAIANIATGSGMTPGGATIEDMSSSGSDPDPDGTGETTDQSGTTNTTLSEDADAGLAKRVVSTRVTPDGCTELVYEFNIENLGNVTISDIQVEDDLAGAGFGACTDGTNTTVTTTLTSDEFTVNDAYNGLGNNDLLIGTDNINPGDVGSILLTVSACGCPAGSPIANTATLSGTSPGGPDGNISDVSDSGSDPDSNDDGEDGIDEMDPTTSTIGEMPDFGVAKREVGVWLQDDGCFLVTYELNVENLGTAPISNLQVVDNLDETPGAGYDACASYIIKELTSDDFIVNDAYDGNADTDLLVGTDLLEVGDKGAILFTVEACGCPDGTAIANIATGSGMTPGGATIEDMSSSGSDPDPDGNGETTDESGTTNTSLTQNPVIGTSKRLVQLINNSDGSSTVSFEFNIQNYGNVELTNVQLMDDLSATFDAPCAVNVLTITSDDFKVNPSFDGVVDTDLLLGNDNLTVDDKGAILLTINVSNCGSNTGPFENQAIASAGTSSGGSAMDLSTDGSDPDPDGDDNPDEQVPTTIEFEFISNIGLAKNAVAVVNNADGSSIVTYEFNIENFGNQIIRDIQVVDILSATFTGCSSIEVLELTSDDFTVNTSVPFDGVGMNNLLEGTDSLEVGDQGAILLTVRTECGGLTGPFFNFARVEGVAADGTNLADLSQNGSEPDPNGDGSPTDNNIPTPVSFGFTPGIGVSKSVSRGPFLNDDGCFDMVYEIRVQNFGDVDLANMQVIEDLAATFMLAESFTVTGLESEEFAVNTDFDGVGDKMLLNGLDTLIAVTGGNEGAIYVYVNVCSGGNTGPYLNTVTASGTPPNGLVISDISTDGSDPDPNGDGIPDEMVPTPVTLEFAPAIGLAKRLASIEMITDDCARVTYEFNIENFGNTDLDSLQLMDDLLTAFGGCTGDVSIFEITSDDFSVNANYADALTSKNLLSGQDDLPIGDRGSVILRVDACTCGTSVVTNSATISSKNPAGDTVMDVSADGSDPDPNMDGAPLEDGATVHTIVCTVAIVCPDVHDPVNVQNDQEECGAIVNFPDARIESNCTDIDEMDIQFMLNAADGSLPVTDPANGDIVVDYGVWHDGQAGGLDYPVDTIMVTYRINPDDLPTGITAPIQNPGMCSFEVIVRDEQCPEFVTTMPEDTVTYDCVIPDTFIVNAPWHLRDNCSEPEEIAVEFAEIKFDSICPNTFTLKRTWMITDEAGNTCEHNHKIFMRDTMAPVITLPPDTTITECALDTVITNCRLLLTPVDTLDSLVVIGGEWVFTKIIVKDTSEVCDTFLTAVDLLEAGMATATDGFCSPLDEIRITFRDSLDLLCKGDKAGIIHRFWIAEDECGNIDSAVQMITIIDPNPPELVVKDEVTVSIGPDGHRSLIAQDVIVRLQDACFIDSSDLIVDIQPSYFNCSDIGEHRVVVSATDPCNNKTAYAEVLVTVIDYVAPVLNCPTTTVNIDIDPGNCDASFIGITEILGSDDCDVVVSTEPPLSAAIDMNTTSILVTATDASGNTSTCDVNVSVNLTAPIDFNQAISCNDRVNVSLGGECWLELNPDLILEGGGQLCSELLYIDVTDENGADHLNFFDESDIGQLFRVTVKDCNGSGNSCWAEVLLEEKQIPIVQWPVDTTLLCVEPTSPDYFKLGYPEVLNCEPEWRYDYEDVYREFDECSSPRATIERRWLVADDEGNVQRDTQIINIIPFSTNHVLFPEDITIEDPIDCAKVEDSFLAIETGQIDPASVIHPDSTGFPNIFGLSLNTDKGLCLFSMDYEDRVLEICGGSFQILRQWTLNNVCSAYEDGVNPINHTQVITIYDVEGPEVEDVRAPITVSINPWQCTFAGILPLPDSINRSCGLVDFEAYVTGEGSGFIQVDGEFESNDLVVAGVGIEEGVHWVTYVYKDGCANIELFKYQINVIDLVDPVAVCQDNIKVSITGGSDGGAAKLFAESVDADSHDAGCGPVTTCMVRMVDFEAGLLDTMIDGKLTYRAVNSCSIDGEFRDTLLDKNGLIESIDVIPYVLCHDAVKFCCDDIGVQMVVLHTFDDHGNSNVCMAEVTVEDKTSALLNCQPHSIVCTDDKDEDLGRPIGTNSICGDELPLLYIDDSEFLNGCGEGQIFRTWYLDTNGNGEKDEEETYCNQVVTVSNPTSFDPYTIKWPKHHTGEIYQGVNLECNDDDVLIEFEQEVSMGAVFSCSVGEVSSTPIWCNTSCGLVGISSQVDTVEASDACLKLIKRWTVIDWCYWEVNGGDVDDENDGANDEFQAVEDWAQGVCAGCDENVSPDPVYFRYTKVDRDGYYTYDQVIKVVDDTAPTVEAADVVVNTTGGAASKDDDAACTGTGIVTATASDLCDSTIVASELLNWVIRYDNGTAVTTSTASGASVSVETQAGSPGDEHTVSFVVSDGCGNASTTTSTVTFGDEKAPVPLCIAGVTTAFMQSGGTVAVWAKDFDLGSFDNCSEIDYSVVRSGELPITPDSTDFGSQSNIEFDCDDLRSVYDLDVWIWDTSGNGDFCTVSVIVGGECSNDEQGSGSIISGQITTEAGDRIEGVTVTVASQELQEYPKSMITEANGEYAFYNNPLGADYQIRSSKDYDYLNGVSTLDIVLIMRHILGTDTFESAYKVIASDVNNDYKISASDVVVLRKLILGIQEDLPNNESWRFVDKTHQFEDTSQPWPFVEVVNIENMARAMSQDIVGVKIGDVNGDVQSNGLLRSEVRSVGSIQMSTLDQHYQAGSEVIVEMKANDLFDLKGMQMTVQHTGLSYVGVVPGQLAMSADHIGVHESQLTISYDGTESMLSDDEALFSLIFRAEESGSIASSLDINSSITRAEAYQGKDLDQYEISFEIEESASAVSILYQNDPNPFATTTKIRFELPSAATASVIIYDVTGKELKRYEGQYGQGMHSIDVNQRELENAGLYYYQLKVDGQFIDSKKMMVIK